MEKKKNTADEYVNAFSKGKDLFGEVIFVGPTQRSKFTAKHPSCNIDLTDCFRVTQMFGNKCSILHGTTVHKVETKFFLTKNHDYQPYPKPH